MLAVAAVAAALNLFASNIQAQDSAAPPPGQGQGGGRQRGGGGGGFGGGNFDPAQFQQRMMDRTMEILEVTDDTERKALEPLVQKVMDARMASFSGMGRGMFGGRGGRGGQNGGNQDQANGNTRRGPFGGTPMPEADTLQKAIDSKASKADMKAALEKYAEARKAKQAELEKAQADLRKVLTLRQEALATLNGLL